MLAVDLIEKAKRHGIGIELTEQGIGLHCHESHPDADLVRELENNADAIASFLRALLAPATPRLETVERPAVLPLSFAQERLWFLERLGLVGSAYTVPIALSMEGTLNVAALERAFSELMRRHEILRTRFPLRATSPIQVIDPLVGFHLDRIAIGDADDASAERELQGHIDVIVNRRFDLARGPLFEVTLLEFSPVKHILLVAMHHIVSDGWSISILVQELRELYSAFSQGRRPSLPQLSFQYADYAIWQRSWLQGAVLREQLAFWRKQLDGAPRMLALPYDRPRPPVASFKGAKHNFSVSKQLSARLSRIAGDENVTLFMLLLSAYQVLLSRLTGQDDIVVGSSVAGRTHRQTEALIGFFVNTLLFRLRIRPTDSFRDVLRHVRETALGAYAHQDLPFERLVAELQPERDLSHQPLFQAAFVLQNAPRGRFELSGLTVHPIAYEQTTTKADLFLAAFGTADGLTFSLEYATDLLESSTVARWMEYFRRILAAAVDNLDIPVCAITLLSDGEPEQQLRGWRGTPLPYPSELCIHELLSQRPQHSANSVALSDEFAEMRYGELDVRANQLAHHLRTLGVGPETVVALWLRRRMQAVVAILGIFKAGAAYMPLDERLPADRLRHMLTDAGAVTLITEVALREGVPGYPGSIVVLDDDRERALIDSQPIEAPSTGVRPQNLACVFYTSGSTGYPKGVCVPHRSVVNLVEATVRAFDIGPQDCVLQFARFAFDVSLQEILVTLRAGARLHVPSQEHSMFLGREMESTIVERRITTLMLPSSVLPLLPRSLAGVVRRIFVGGDVLDPTHARFWSQQCPLVNEYGPTETTVCATYEECKPDDSAPAVSIGRPIANASAYVLDDSLDLVPVGVTGELCIAGPGVTRGYLRQPGLTARRFVADPFGPPGTRMYRSGDRARYRSDGRIEFAGRTDLQVKVRGQRIELGEVEAVVQRAPGVLQAVAAASKGADGEHRLVCFVVIDPGMLIARVAHRLPEARDSTFRHWLRLFNEEYAGAVTTGPDYIGWNSSYTGKPIDAPDMDEWLQGAVQRVLRLQPRSVLEIGCGSGLLIRQLAPHCARYRGMDFSRAAIDAATKWVRSRPEFSHVELEQQEASVAASQCMGYDTVVLNSVVQYLPGVTIFAEILRDLLRRLPGGAHMFIGDVRHLGLLRVFHVSVQLEKARSQAEWPQLTVGELKRRISRALEQERELAIDPTLFNLIAADFGAQARAELKRGRSANELTRYRYDVTIDCGRTDPRPQRSSPTDFTWSSGKASLARLAEQLRTSPRMCVHMTGIPNRRVARDVAMQRLIDASNDTSLVEELYERIRALPVEGEDPEEFWRLGEQSGFSVEVYWSADGTHFDVLLHGALAPQDAGKMETTPIPSPDVKADLTRYANNPLAGQLASLWSAQLHEDLSDQLPDYMLPDVFVILDVMPLTENGKVDRKRLTAPQSIARSVEYRAPVTPLHRMLAKLWADALRLDQVGLDDDFFRLGAHSLLTAHVATQISEILSTDVSVRSVFEHPTIASLAEYLGSCGSLVSSDEDIVEVTI
jgi:amino acid adenylation domain-containing protein